jgi:hypothetical protein
MPPQRARGITKAGLPAKNATSATLDEAAMMQALRFLQPEVEALSARFDALEALARLRLDPLQAVGAALQFG